MRITKIPCTDFLKYENTHNSKILLNICNHNTYGITDSNTFYSRFYTKIESDFKKQNDLKFGHNFYTEIFSYEIICNMICVKWPKTQYNIKPFNLNYFKSCCKQCSDYMLKNNIEDIYTPVFGTEILEGRWNEILETLNTYFPSKNLFLFR